jgi:hypothetical protein
MAVTNNIFYNIMLRSLDGILQEARLGALLVLTVLTTY